MLWCLSLGRKCSGKSKEEQGLAGCRVGRKPSRAGLHSLGGRWLTGELAVLIQPGGSDTLQGSPASEGWTLPRGAAALELALPG